MFRHLSTNTMLALKKWAYVFCWALLLPMVPVSAMAGRDSGSQNLWAWAILGIFFVAIPILDFLIGKDPVNPDEKEQVPGLSEDKSYRLIPLAMATAWIGLLFYAGYVFTHTPYAWYGSLGWIISIGMLGGVIAINLGHELIHKDPKVENWTGGLLLASVTYAGFKVEHIRGHHIHVSTPEDASSSQYNQDLYDFLPKAFCRNFLNAWKLEAAYLSRKGKKAVSIHNELIWWYGISALFALTFGLLWGWQGVLFFVGQSLFAALALEIVNYIEHYGLHRRQLDNGRYERVTPAHSWNSNYLLTNLILFQLQRHSDHHAYAKRRYQVLRHYDESPQLPAGYTAMMLLAMVPPLWKKVMNPKVERYYQGEMDQLFRDVQRVNNIS
ncbi:alkane-1 monooxygenase [Alcanivorax hongdengensis A-11-3]|uniref:Alkane-1 monooxygenase n=1 Tax=Alcanivorax hongdengensis A-11-3 TaxID=1177179 RepID=L0WCZ5_9GAMM|nr:alkane 1-monooxygenase [Alcanivorax hongdengensis]EKF74618.1 alkane-1 monooxygenase [Alcanivorax hongdengensis A-11-3]